MAVSRFEMGLMAESGREVDIISNYRTLRGESEPKAQCICEVISHLRGFERQAKVP